MMRAGDRVRVKEPRSGQPWHTANGREYRSECKPGELGTIQRGSHPGTAAHVRWDSGKTSLIDLNCIEPLTENEPDDEEKELDQEALRLFGISTRHCKTCTCKD